ncbi:MAG: Trypsin [candidate division WS6 bacterium GW2011_GWE1_34_7]|uniref:Trypsin n=1 Tax=candidate division WS6 bacterium GW2011_GWE1_34_7 TaxID=1619093 RepID=A0A0G0E8Z9_9BACT|nr:MAG: Trypsin [candidate division WS6 bacterium GW2011_GWE1_34_7]
MEEVNKSKKDLKLNFDNYKHFKVFGISLLFITVILVALVSFIFLIRYSETLQDLVLKGDVENSKEDGITLTVTQEENVIINVVQDASPSVVSIAVTQLTLKSGEGLVDEVSNIGTGFVVDPNGIIITNQHVVSDTSATYKVITNDGKEYEVVEILRDDSNDIAVLKIDATSLDSLELGDSDSLLVGQTVIAIGNPLGEYAGSVTTGVISGVNRSVTTSSGWFGSTTKVYEDVIQTDAAVNPGNSGGPLISTEGKVIGVNFATTSNADNISFALPINRVKQRLDEYRTYGKFIKPYIGISYRMISEYEAMYYKDVVAGALVMNIDPQGPASSTDLARGDIITKIQGKEVNQSFAYIIQSYKVGEKISLEVWNSGKSRTLEITLQEAD